MPSLGKPAKRLVKQVKQVQELLGDDQDVVVARPVLREIGMAAHLDGKNGFTYWILHQQQTDARGLHGPMSPPPGGTCGAACGSSPHEGTPLW